MGNINAVTLASVIAALASGLFALVGVVVTSILAKRREHETDWRKIRIEHYQEYLASVSGMLPGRATPTTQERYADAVNTLALVAPPSVLKAVDTFQNEISYRNTNRSDEAHDRLLGLVIHAMRNDVQPRGTTDAEAAPFRLLDVPPSTAYRQKQSD